VHTSLRALGPARPRKLRASDRRLLERAGWRTLLAYREDQVRDADGTLVAVRARWIAEAEHVTGRWIECEVVGTDACAAWARLRNEAAST
jgi:hypothetical protein